MRGTFNPTTGASSGQADGPVLDDPARDGSAPSGPVLDAIAAYDQVAPGFRELSARRRAYLDAVDAEILRLVPKPADSLIDVGAGDGRRALQIAASAHLSRVVLVEPSAGMRELIPAGVEVWADRMEALPDRRMTFDVVMCLWNVLGHVPTPELRVLALRNLKRLCAPGGLIFLDVLNRYNVAECGVRVVLLRLVSPGWNGDVPVKWRTEAGEVETRGHVFTRGEMEGLFRKSGLSVVERRVLDYRTGRKRAWAVGGNFFYVLRSGEV